MKKRLSPSLLSADFAHLARDMALAGRADWMHIDVMDGHFVPNITIGVPVVKSLRRATSLPLDVHLMITDPSRYLDAFLDAGADILTLHVETETPEKLAAALSRIRARGKKAALTLKPATPIAALEPFWPLLDMVLVMTVEPGFGGQGFLPESIPKIENLRARLDAVNPTCEIEVDGGITLDNLRAVAEAGANVFVAGSAVFGAPDIPARVEEFLQLLRD